MTLFLSQREVSRLLTIERALEIVEQVFREQGTGLVVAHPSFPISVGKWSFRVHSGALLASRRVGVRLLPDRAQPAGQKEVTVLCDSESGDLLGVISFPLSKIRIGAVMGVAAKHLAPPQCRTIGMLGTGKNALTILQYVRAVRPSVNEIWVYSRSKEHRESFARQAQEAMGITVQPAPRAEDAVSGKEIVLTSTDSVIPVLKAGWLRPGSYFASTGFPGEVDGEIFVRAARVVVSGKAQNRASAGRLENPLASVIGEGRLSWDDVHELGEVVCRPDMLPDRDGITVFQGSQGGFGELAMAAWLHEEAERQGIGHKIDLGD
jgi:ornithine cyclodeaminase/alanine dehydrogenase-like protein (mu-crystallin family)